MAISRNDRKTKVVGKICPRCGMLGKVVYQTSERIVYECPNGYQYQTKKPLFRQKSELVRKQPL